MMRRTEPAYAGESFRSAFRRIAVFLGRPGSDVVLFSGVPFDETSPSLEDGFKVQEVLDAIGRSVQTGRSVDIQRAQRTRPGT